MNVSITDRNETRKDVVVTLEGDEVDREEKRVLREIQKKARIRGFRPGKAPESRIRQLYSRDIQSELKQALMRKAYEEVLKHDGLEVYAVVDFPEPGDILAGQEVSLDLTVDVNPPFDLPEYKGIPTQPPSTEVEDREIDEAIDRIRSQRADFVVVEREAGESDYVKISYTGKLEGQPIADQLEEHPRVRAWGTVTNGWEEAGTESGRQFGVPAVIDALVGMKAGDTKEVEQVIPEDFPIEALRGKAVQYSLEAEEVRERKLPEINEEFLRSVHAETLEDFKSQIFDELERQKAREADDAQRNQILEFLSNAVDFPLPESALEAETQSAMARIISNNLQQGVPEEEFEKHKEEIHAGALNAARREVKIQILLGRIAREEKITVENEDLSRALYGMAIQQQQKPEELVREFRKDRERLLRLQRQILHSKTLDFLRREAKTGDSPEADTENPES